MSRLEIDCPPGCPRPGDLLRGVLAGTGIELGKPNSTFFGCWTWEIPAHLETAYGVAQEIIGTRLDALYKRGTIRYCAW